MALVVESTSSVATSNADSLTITKPSGVATGDLLIIVAVGEHDANNGESSGPACSGFTQAVVTNRNSNNVTLRQNMSASLLYRVADASDVSASNYTITLAGSESLGIAAMMRVSGWTSGNPVYAKSENDTTLGASGLSLTRPNSSLLIMMGASKADTGGSGTFSAQSVTTSGSNPSWTEVVDTNVTVNTSSDAFTLSSAVAYANDSDTSNITAYSQSSTAGGDNVFMSFLAVIVEPTNATGTHALLEPATTFFTEAAVEVGGNGTNDLLEPVTTFLPPTARGSAPTTYTNEAKSSTTWTNPDK